MNANQKKKLEEARKNFQKQSGGKIEEITGQLKFFKFDDENPFVNGVFKGFKDFVSPKFGKQKHSVVSVGEDTFMLPSHIQLTKKMEECNTGDNVFIEVTGIETTSNGEMATYNVLRVKK